MSYSHSGLELGQVSIFIPQEKRSRRKAPQRDTHVTRTGDRFFDFKVSLKIKGYERTSKHTEIGSPFLTFFFLFTSSLGGMRKSCVPENQGDRFLLEPKTTITTKPTSTTRLSSRRNTHPFRRLSRPSFFLCFVCFCAPFNRDGKTGVSRIKGFFLNKVLKILNMDDTSKHRIRREVFYFSSLFFVFVMTLEWRYYQQEIQN